MHRHVHTSRRRYRHFMVHPFRRRSVLSSSSSMLLFLLVLLWSVVLAQQQSINDTDTTIDLNDDNNNNNNNNDDDDDLTNDTNTTTSSGRNRANDLFNYDTNQHTDNYFNYGPQDWGDIRCPDETTCTGWVDKWEYGINWELGGGCEWCPDSGENSDASCGRHHQSPINLERFVADETNSQFKECIDLHWMKYIDSACSYDQLVAKNAIFVDRHALRVVQPIVPGGEGNLTHRLACRATDASWGRIDFSKGFSQWWYLSHIDFHVPSEHLQEGKRYDGEMQIYHFYSVSGEEAGVNNEMGTVTIFLEAYDDSPDYDVLNKLICTWRAHEEMIRAECGIDSVLSEYPGCMSYSRRDGSGVATQGTSRRMRHGAADDRDRTPRRAMSAHDVILNNHINMALDETYEPATILLNNDRHDVDDNDIDWDAFIAEQYMKDEENHHGRELLNYDHVDWFNYFGMLGVRTEYYYRYSGTQTIPPCHGKFVPEGNRENTNHWRVMKDPLRISKRQLNEMHRLLRERIAPIDAPVNACMSDTAAKVNVETGEVNVARPLQSKNEIHYVTFCECDDWKSKWIEDQNWCSITDKKTRFYDRPYNFVANEF